MSNRYAPIFLAVVAASLASGCAVDADDGPGDDTATPAGEAPDDAEFYETVVTMSLDGTVTISAPRLVTAGQQRAENELRLAVERGEAEWPASLTADGGCPPTAVWIYSGTNRTGRRICFSGTGSVLLKDYYQFADIGGVPTPIGTWQIASGSIYPGDKFGVIAGRPW